MTQRVKNMTILNLKAGDWVEVRSQEEILATLDETGRLGNLPFMPEMLRFCGRQFRVSKRADKTCDNIQSWSIRRAQDTVHLENLRCDGSTHGGCEAGCLLFWHEAWLVRSSQEIVQPIPAQASDAETSEAGSNFVALERLLESTHRKNSDGENIFTCQATELRGFTSHMAWWDPRQYIRDVRSGNLSNGYLGNSITERLLELCLNVLSVLRAVAISVFRRRGLVYPDVQGTTEKTPSGSLGLQPGEWVKVRSKDEIVATLDSKSKNRGLYFGGSMLDYCGGMYRVLRRVHNIIDEKTGRMLHMKQPCIVLEGVWCQMSEYYRFCPKAIYHYWREIWLERVSELPQSATDLLSDSHQSVESKIFFPIGPR